MPTREKVPAASAGQYGAIAAIALEQCPLSSEEIHRIITSPKLNKNFRRGLQELYAQFQFSEAALSNKLHVADLSRWTRVYKKYFGKRSDFSDLVVPDKPGNLGPVRLIVVAKELIGWTRSRPIDGTLKVFEGHFVTRLLTQSANDASLVHNDRGPFNGTYALWVRDVREADNPDVNLHPDHFWGNHSGITFLERMLLEMDYFEERGEHLDQDHWNVCIGSRTGSEDSLCVGWRGSTLVVGDCTHTRAVGQDSRNVYGFSSL